MHRRLLPKTVMLLAMVISVGCNDDGDTGTADAGGSSRVDAGLSGRDAGNGRTTPEPVTMVECGTSICMAPAAVGGVALNACCADEAKNTCGVSMSVGGACSAPVMSDPRCPSVDFQGLMLASCCTDTGQCGIDASRFGMPCIGLEAAAAGAMSMAMGAGFEFPKPRSCDEQDGGGGDAGSTDAGGGDAGSADAGGGDAGSTDAGGV